MSDDTDSDIEVTGFKGDDVGAATHHHPPRAAALRASPELHTARRSAPATIPEALTHRCVLADRAQRGAFALRLRQLQVSGQG